MNNGFARQLARYGPKGNHPPFRLGEAQMYCRWLAQSHYENFSVASILLPRRLVQHFHNVYAYCRWADDLADEASGGAEAMELLRWWREELVRCYGGTPHHPVMIALKETIEQFGIPREPFLNLLFAFEQDQLIKRYSTFDQLLGYCQNSANPVGHLVLYLCESYGEEQARLSDLICTGLQLANFWQDVGRDLDIGRVYLPEEDMARFRYSEDDLLQRRFTRSFAALLEYEVEQTRDILYRGYPLVDLVPSDVQLDIELFIQGGLGILQKIEQQSFDVWTARPALAKWEKGLLVCGVLWRHWRRTWLRW